MPEFAAFLRGINVGGVRIAMTDLAAALRAQGLEDVRTVLATGNAVFRAERGTAAALERRLSQALSQEFDYEARVFLRSPRQLRRIVDDYPFEADDEGMQPYVMLTSDAGARKALLGLGPTLDPAEERIAPGPGAIYWEVRRGRSTESGFAKASNKAAVRSSTTTRNLRTLAKVLAVTE